MFFTCLLLPTIGCNFGGHSGSSHYPRQLFRCRECWWQAVGSSGRTVIWLTSGEDRMRLRRRWIWGKTGGVSHRWWAIFANFFFSRAHAHALFFLPVTGCEYVPHGPYDRLERGDSAWILISTREGR
jgi:hypothetical protein